MKISKTIVAVVAAVGLTAGGAVAANSMLNEDEAVVASSGQWQLLRTAEGVLMDNPFDRAITAREVQDTYEFNGDTDPALAFVRATDGGLQVGVQPMPNAEAHNGYFAVTHDAYPETSIFHVRMSKQPGQVQSATEVGQAVFAVQTASTKITGLINFIVLSADSTEGMTSWRIGYMYGHVRNAAYVNYYSTEPSVDSPDTQEVTLRTDGRRTLTVWFGKEQVFHSDKLEMDIQAPYQPYLEVQAVKTAYVSSFQNFWVTEDDDLQLTGLPDGADVRLVDDQGAVLGETAARTGGTATLELPPYAAKGSGTLEITERGREPVRLGSFQYAGGDELQVVVK
jgi:Tfp pilus assembly protein PilV